MYIGLFDYDYNKNKAPFPNLEMMKISAYHKSQKDIVALFSDAREYTQFSKIYLRKNRQDLNFPDALMSAAKDKIDIGGLAFSGGKYIPLPAEIERFPPDRFLYKIKNEMPTSYKEKYKFAQKSNLLRLETCQTMPEVSTLENTIIYDKTPNLQPFFYEVVDKTSFKVCIVYPPICDTWEEIERISKIQKINIGHSKAPIYTNYLMNRDIMHISTDDYHLSVKINFFDEDCKDISFETWCHKMSQQLNRLRLIYKKGKLLLNENQFNNSKIIKTIENCNYYKSDINLIDIKKYDVALYNFLIGVRKK